MMLRNPARRLATLIRAAPQSSSRRSAAKGSKLEVTKAINDQDKLEGRVSYRSSEVLYLPGEEETGKKAEQQLYICMKCHLDDQQTHVPLSLLSTSPAAIALAKTKRSSRPLTAQPTAPHPSSQLPDQSSRHTHYTNRRIPHSAVQRFYLLLAQ